MRLVTAKTPPEPCEYNPLHYEESWQKLSRSALDDSRALRASLERKRLIDRSFLEASGATGTVTILGNRSGGWAKAQLIEELDFMAYHTLE